MQIDVYVPPAVEHYGHFAGWLVRCKPENDCASLFAPTVDRMMYSDADDAIADVLKHAERCPEHHAIVAVARGSEL